MIQPNAFLDALEAYTPGDQPQDPDCVKLNTNEFPYPAAPGVLAAIREAANDAVRLYPSPRCDALRRALAQRHGLEPDRIFVGNGSDETLRLLTAGWGGPSRMTAAVAPSYSLFSSLVQLTGAQLQEFELQHLENLPEALFCHGWDLLMLPVPNPPLGTMFPLDHLERLAERDGLLVLDEAYIEFADDPSAHLALMQRRPNVAISRTFSKSFGLAGLRVGYVMAAPEIIDVLSRMADSYNVNRISQAAAVAALESADYYREMNRKIREDRRWLSGELKTRGFDVPESQGNFVFARHERAAEIYEALRERRIYVRYFGQGGVLPPGVRVTIGTRAQLEQLVAALDATAPQWRR